MMVDQLADRWGVELDRDTEVWFEFRRPSDAGGDRRPDDTLCLQ
jgi:hypothetical protein